MENLKKGDIVQVNAQMSFGEIQLKCKVVEYKNDNGFPKQPTFRALEDCKKLKKGQTFLGSLLDIVSIVQTDDPTEPPTT